MKMVIKKKQLTIEEARTFKDATENLGKFTKTLASRIVDYLEKQDPKFRDSVDKAMEKSPNTLKLIQESFIEKIVNTVVASIPEKVNYQGRLYEVPDGDRVALFDWFKRLLLSENSGILDKLMMLEGTQLDPDDVDAIGRFGLSKQFAYLKDEKGNKVKDQKGKEITITLDQIQSLEQLKEISYESFEVWKEKDKKKREKQGLKSKNENIEQLISADPDWEILIPHDKQAAIYLGQICSSRWCTAARSANNMFDRYYSKDDPMFVIKHKTKKEVAEVNKPNTYEVEKITVPMMYQVHFSSQQFKNRKDEEVPEKTRKLLLDLIQNSKTTDGNSIQNIYPVVENVKMQETEEGFTMFAKNKQGDQEWFLNGERHRVGGPAVIESDGTERWYLNGKLHREDGPAEEFKNGTKRWYRVGELHRKDGPAELYLDGTKRWFFDGKLHREDGPAEEWADGSKKWFRYNKPHREDGPAVEMKDGTKIWYLNWRRHREDGPAVIEPGGVKKWFLNDQLIAKTDKNDVSTPPEFIRAGGKEWDSQNDPWLGQKASLQERFNRFSVLWGRK